MTERIVRIRRRGDVFDVEVIERGWIRVARRGIGLFEAALIFNCEPDAHVVFYDKSGRPVMYRLPHEAVPYPQYTPLSYEASEDSGPR